MTQTRQRPNILFIMSDDHAYQAITAYRPDFPIRTPGIDRLATEGCRLDRMYCTNSICAPSRASILTGNYNHLNGVRKLHNNLDKRLPNVAKSLQAVGYQTCIIGKWHLGNTDPYLPSGFDNYAIFDGQGEYYNPEWITPEGRERSEGYVTELLTTRCLDWLEERDRKKPFFLMCHHKAPHRNWQASPKYQHAFDKVNFPHPRTYRDDYASRGPAVAAATMRIDDLTAHDFKDRPLPDLDEDALRDWKFQHYMADYTATIASVDDSVAELLAYLDAEGLSDDTIVIYTSDQGFYLGEHGWFDKRLIYEESHRMPFLIRYPREIDPASINEELVLNIDLADTFLDYAGAKGSLPCQGRSIRSIIRGEEEGYETIYYRYWDYPSEHNVYPHSGVRTKRYLLARFIDPTDGDRVYYELYDHIRDKDEVNNLIDDPAYAELVVELKAKLEHLKKHYEDFDPDPAYREIP
ncbi:MAG: sulfatase [Eubacteriales bacterium]|nr:sulfatase [Eubacteriales bacterium]